MGSSSSISKKDTHGPPTMKSTESENKALREEIKRMELELKTLQIEDKTDDLKRLQEENKQLKNKLNTTISCNCSTSPTLSEKLSPSQKSLKHSKITTGISKARNDIDAYGQGIAPTGSNGSYRRRNRRTSRPNNGSTPDLGSAKTSNKNSPDNSSIE